MTDRIILWLALTAIVVSVWQITGWGIGAATIVLILLVAYLHRTDRKHDEWKRRWRLREETWRMGDRRTTKGEEL